MAEWIEAHHPGMIEAHCARPRAYEEGQRTMDGRPQIRLPETGRPDSEFAQAMGKALEAQGHQCRVQLRLRAAYDRK